MPTVPTEQNRVGIAGLTDARLQAGDYSGTGLQALGAGMRTLGAAGAESAETMVRARKIAADAARQPVVPGTVAQAIDTTSHEALHASMPHPSPEEIRDDAICKIGWNQFSSVCRGVWAELEGQKGFGAVLSVEPAIEALNAEYKRGLGMLPAELHPVYEGSVGARLPMEVAGLQAFGAAQSAVEQDRQSLLAQQNAADDAVRHADNPDMFDRHVETGAGSIATQGALRGDDPATIDGAIRAYRSGINRRVLEEMTEKDPMATAFRYGAVRESMTPDDQLAVEKGLYEPLIHAQAANDVDRFLPPRERGQPPSPLSPEARAAAQAAIEAEPWNEARKRYALDDLAERGSMHERSRKQAEDAARDSGFATAEQIGSGFTSITQIPAAVRRDLDEETDRALRSLAQANLDPTPIAPGGEMSLMMNIIASENPAAFAKEDLRLIRGKVTQEEYGKFQRLQRGLGQETPSGVAALQRRVADVIGPYFGLATQIRGGGVLRNASAGADKRITFDSNGRPTVGTDGKSVLETVLSPLFPPPAPAGRQRSVEELERKRPSNSAGLDYTGFPAFWEAERKKGAALPKFVPAPAWKQNPDIEKEVDLAADDGAYDRITLHHTGSLNTPQAVDDLHRGRETAWHYAARYARNLGPPEPYDTMGDVAYHFFIDEDGTIYEGRSLKYMGAHVSGQNARNIGIAFLGNYSDRELSKAQFNSAKFLIMELNKAYNVGGNAKGKPYIFTHTDLAVSAKGHHKRDAELIGAKRQTDALKTWSLPIARKPTRPTAGRTKRVRTP
ncbi:MAG: peptidoglycan recognition family protein [Sphingomonas sp.]|jgi:hypothetical protein|uniref:peptidoglycan recognition protein family protein n=1 Tax=Sphingomonas sp. TaxID=28214 RepID=UPI003562E70A